MAQTAPLIALLIILGACGPVYPDGAEYRPARDTAVYFLMDSAHAPFRVRTIARVEDATSSVRVMATENGDVAMIAMNRRAHIATVKAERLKTWVLSAQAWLDSAAAGQYTLSPPNEDDAGQEFLEIQIARRPAGRPWALVTTRDATAWFRRMDEPVLRHFLASLAAAADSAREMAARHSAVMP